MYHLLTNMHVDPELLVLCEKKKIIVTGNRHQPSSGSRGSPRGLTHTTHTRLLPGRAGVGDQENKTIRTKSRYCSEV